MVNHKITKHKRRNSSHKITKHKKRGGSGPSSGNSSINRAIYTPTTTEELKNTIILFRNKDNIQTLLSTYGEMRSWNISLITNMTFIFEDYRFDNTYDTISNWDVSNVENMRLMFFKSTNFNQNLSKVDGVFVTNENILETMIGCDIPGSVIELCVAKESAKELIFAYASNQLRHFY